MLIHRRRLFDVLAVLVALALVLGVIIFLSQRTTVEPDQVDRRVVRVRNSDHSKRFPLIQGSFAIAKCAEFGFLVNSTESLVASNTQVITLFANPRRDVKPSMRKNCDVTIKLATVPKDVLSLKSPANVSLALGSNSDADSEVSWIVATGRSGESTIQLSVTSLSGKSIASFAKQITVKRNSDSELAAQVATKYVRDTAVSTPGDLNIKGLGRRAVVDVAAELPALYIPRGMDPAATLRMCIQAAGAATSPRRCRDIAVDLTSKSRVVTPFEIRVDQPGRIALICDLTLDYYTDGVAKTYSDARSSTAGESKESVTDKVGEVAPTANSTISALGGAAGVLALLAAVGGLWQRRRKRNASATSSGARRARS